PTSLVSPPTIDAGAEPVPPTAAGIPDNATSIVPATTTDATRDTVPPTAGGVPAPDPAAASAPVKRAYPAPAEVPTQQGARGLQFDFNDGCRVVLSESEHPWRVRLSDLDTGNILFETEIRGGRVNSSKRYFVRFRLEVWQNGQSVLVHDYSAANRDVLIQFPVGTL